LFENRIVQHIFCVLAIVLFSTIEVVGKMMGTEISPYAVTAWRFLIGGMVILPFALLEIKRNNIKIIGKDYLGFALAGILNVCISMLFLQLSVYYGKAVLSAVIVSTNPLFVTILAYLFLKEEISFYHVFGLLLGILGLVLIIYGERIVLAKSENLLWGVIYAFAAAITFAIYTVFSKKLLIRNGNLPTISFAFIGGAISLFAYSIFTGKQVTFTPSSLNIGCLIYLSLFVTGIAYIMYFFSVRNLGAAKSSQYFFLKPAIAATLAWLIHKESIQPFQIVGIGLIMISLSRDLIVKGLQILSHEENA
jgi:drug/metabolite transporter (DMT)-like permease